MPSTQCGWFESCARRSTRLERQITIAAMRRLLTLSLFFALACGSKKNQFDNPDGDTTTDDGGVDEGGQLGMTDAMDEPMCVTCAADLKTIVTCGEMMPVGQCSGTDGCAGGQCIPACDAASASKSTIGCDYYTIPPDAWTIGSCFAAFVTNTWSTPMKVTLKWQGQTIDGTKYAYVPKGMDNTLTYQAVP